MNRMQSTTKMATGKMALLMWVQKIAIEYGIKVENFDRHFKDGRVLCAIVNYYFPDELDYNLVKIENDEQILNNHKMAFDIAEIHNVFKILDPEDMLTPDRNSIMTYVASMNKEFKPLPKGVPKTKKEQVMKESIQQNNEEFQTIKENILQNLLNVQNFSKPEVNVETKEESVEQGKESQEEQENERKEKERLEQEKEKQKQEKEEQERKEKERLKEEQEKEEYERNEKERFEQEKEKQKQEEELKQEKEEQERKEKERLKQEQENERKEKERLEQEKEKQRQEEEKLKQENEEQQRKEKMRLQEEQEKEELVRKEKERLQQESFEREEREKEKEKRERKQETENFGQQTPKTASDKQSEFHPQMVLVLVYLIIGYFVTGFVISSVLFSFYTYLTLALIFGVSKYFPNLNVIPVILSYPPYVFRFLNYLDLELIQLFLFLKSLLISKGLLQVYQASIVVISLITQVVRPVQDLLGITSGGFSLFIFFFPRLFGFVLGIFF